MNEYTDIMKNLFLPVLLVAGSFFASCTSAVFTPTPSANPWDDNYLSVAKMEDYRQWGEDDAKAGLELLLGNPFG